MHNYWIGLTVKIIAEDEEEAGKEAEELGEWVSKHGNVIEAYWDNNMPEEEYKNET